MLILGNREAADGHGLKGMAVAWDLSESGQRAYLVGLSVGQWAGERPGRWRWSRMHMSSWWYGGAGLAVRDAEMQAVAPHGSRQAVS